MKTDMMDEIYKWENWGSKKTKVKQLVQCPTAGITRDRIRTERLYTKPFFLSYARSCFYKFVLKLIFHGTLSKEEPTSYFL